MIVVAQSYGQLCNRLFLYSHFLAAAMELDFSLANLAFRDYAEFFETTSRDALCRYPVASRFASGRVMVPVRRRALESLAGASGRLGSMRIVDLSINEDQQLDLGSQRFRELVANHRMVFIRDGWLFRSDDFLRDHAEAVRAFFRPVERHRDRVAAVLEGARRGSDVVIGVHIRRQDYSTFLGGRHFYSDNQYAAFMRSAQKIFTGKAVTFLICSDEAIDWRRYSEFQTIPGSGHLIEDLYAFAGCDALLGPPSTYTQWASFYGAVPLCQVTDPSMTINSNSFHSKWADGA